MLVLRIKKKNPQNSHLKEVSRLLRVLLSLKNDTMHSPGCHISTGDNNVGKMAVASILYFGGRRAIL